MIHEQAYFLNMILPSAQLISAAIEHLARIPHIRVDRRARPDREPGAPVAPLAPTDGWLRVITPVGEASYACQVVAHLRPAMIGPLADRLLRLRNHLGAPVLLITSHVNDLLAAELRERDTEYIDTVGNAYLRQPAVYIVMTGARGEAPATSALTATRLKVLFALLRDKELRRADFRTVAATTGVSLGTVSTTMALLVRDGLMRKRRTGYQAVDYEQLLARWEMGYAERLRSKLRPTRFALGPKRDLEALVNVLPEGTLLGGELAGALLTRHLRPATVVLHSHADPLAVAVALRARPSPDGEMTVLGRFSDHDQWTDEATPRPIADPILVRAELLIGGDTRAVETATLLLEDFILARERRAHA